MSDSLSDRLGKCYSGAVYDVLRGMGYPDQVLPETIRPLNPTQILAGRVFTMCGHVDTTLDADTTLLEWTKFLSRAPSDSVIICQPNDSTLAHMGELSSETLSYKKVRGYIVDGGTRDSSLILKIGFPVWCRYCTPKDIVGRWVADAAAFGAPIEIGGIKIHTGDYVLADRDGVVIIPEEIAEEVTERVEEVLRTENKVRTAILKGVDPVDAYLQYRKF